ncbi:MAG: winged helix-turn-helix transcriptional regulator [Halarcobacter sp.]
MRLLSYNIDENLTTYMEDIYITDIAEDLEDAAYHSEVRYYNLILIKENNFFACKDILKGVNSQVTAVIIITDNSSKEFELELLKLGALSILKEPVSNEFILAKIESTHRENFKKEIPFKDRYSINTEEKSFNDDQSKVYLKGKSFAILSYLIKNKHRPPISKDELLHAIWEEPEMVSDNVIEVNINNIRNNLKKEFNENFIETVRHRGYKVIPN